VNISTWLRNSGNSWETTGIEGWRRRLARSGSRASPELARTVENSDYSLESRDPGRFPSMNILICRRRAWSSPARISSVGAAARGCSRWRTCSPPGLEPFTLPVWLVMNDPRQDPQAYLHIHSVLARRIRGGEYPAGARLPTETELAGEFGCAPGTAARALRALQRDGLARKVLRRGYVSSGPDAQPG
jgi:hypothetical protein